LDRDEPNIVHFTNGINDQLEWLRHGRRLLSVPSLMDLPIGQGNLRWCLLKDDDDDA
jgi:hypothetical protein